MELSDINLRSRLRTPRQGKNFIGDLKFGHNWLDGSYASLIHTCATVAWLVTVGPLTGALWRINAWLSLACKVDKSS